MYRVRKKENIRVLLIEKNILDVRLIKENLSLDKDNNYIINTQDKLIDGLKVLDSEIVDIVILDLNFPAINFDKSINLIKNYTRMVPFIILTDIDNERIATKAIKEGVQDYILKDDISFFNLRKSILYSIERQNLMLELNKGKRKLEKRELELENVVDNLNVLLDEIVESLSFFSEIRDPYTSGHQNRVAELAYIIGEKFEFSNQRLECLKTAAKLHDIGKVNIPTEILAKPGKLSDIEMMLIRTHVEIGYEILKNIDFHCSVAEIVLQHHEKIDGSGYPKGLIDNEILLESKILCVADVVEAISSHRPYRPSLGLEVALDELNKNKGIKYDMEVCKKCIEILVNGEWKNK